MKGHLLDLNRIDKFDSMALVDMEMRIMSSNIVVDVITDLEITTDFGSILLLSRFAVYILSADQPSPRHFPSEGGIRTLLDEVAAVVL